MRSCFGPLTGSAICEWPLRIQSRTFVDGNWDSDNDWPDARESIWFGPSAEAASPKERIRAKIRHLRLYDYRARMYQPELGRFLQPDPKQFGAGDYNLYRYCHNDPINFSDPFGDEARFVLMRDAYTAGPNANPRLSAGTMRIFEDGKFRGAVRVNEHGFESGRQGIPQGQYLVLPKAQDGQYPKGAPAVTSPLLKDQPGATTAGHAEGDVLIHGEGGYPDSRACLTLNPAALKLASDVFNRNKNSTTLSVHDGPRVKDGKPDIRQALPVNKLRH
jgi:RHS repeat-associated protein